ncbi:MAG: diguanylate cyclase [Gemmatimonadota bacterium]
MSTILIVSTDAAAAAQVAASLPGEVYEVAVADSGPAGLERAGAPDGVDVILLDRTIVGAGEHLFDRFLSACRSHDIPLLVVGEACGPHQWAPFLNQGASAYLSLPVEAGVLGASVGVFLRVRERLCQLRSQAVIDDLTGIYNRRYLDEQLGVRLGEARRYETPLSLAIIDIDHFKRVNDSFGHQFGDLVLQETAGLVRSLMRKEDILARYGGEEFATILPHTDRLGAAILCERIRESVADHTFAADSHSTRITLSLGVASYPLDEIESTSQLIGKADRRLYRAKEMGRNQTIFD